MVMLDIADLNWWLILVAVFAASLTGMVWYSPVLFGKQWLKAAKTSRKNLAKGDSVTPIIMAVCGHLIVAVVLAEIIYAFGATTLMEGVRIGVLVGAALAAFHLVHSGFKGNKALALINGSYDVVVVLLMAGILAAWR